MLEKLRWRYRDWVLGEFHKYFAIGGHCGLCGKWIENAVTDKDWQVTMCDECGNMES